jgi:tRNA(Ile)-lysidine synthase TilS/MesJ
LCGAQENMQRVAVKNMLAAWERDFPGRRASIFASLQNLAPEHLADPRHFDFAQLRAGAHTAMSDRQERELALRVERAAVQAA